MLFPDLLCFLICICCESFIYRVFVYCSPIHSSRPIEMYHWEASPKLSAQVQISKAAALYSKALAVLSSGTLVIFSFSPGLSELQLPFCRLEMIMLTSRDLCEESMAQAFYGPGMSTPQCILILSLQYSSEYAYFIFH